MLHHEDRRSTMRLRLDDFARPPWIGKDVGSRLRSVRAGLRTKKDEGRIDRPSSWFEAGLLVDQRSLVAHARPGSSSGAGHPPSPASWSGSFGDREDLPTVRHEHLAAVGAGEDLAPVGFGRSTFMLERRLARRHAVGVAIRVLHAFLQVGKHLLIVRRRRVLHSARPGRYEYIAAVTVASQSQACCTCPCLRAAASAGMNPQATDADRDPRRGGSTPALAAARSDRSRLWTGDFDLGRITER